MARTLYQQIYRLWLLEQLRQKKDFRSVAREVGITPSALTQSVKALEEYFGKNLLIRSGDGPELTLEGNEILESLQCVFSELNTIEHSLSGNDAPKRLVIGSYDSWLCLNSCSKRRFNSKVDINYGNIWYLCLIKSFLTKAKIDAKDVIFNSDSFEVVARVAMAGYVKAVLPRDVAGLYSDRLKLIYVDPDQSHCIQLISRKTLQASIKELVAIAVVENSR